MKNIYSLRVIKIDIYSRRKDHQQTQYLSSKWIIIENKWTNTTKNIEAIFNLSSCNNTAATKTLLFVLPLFAYKKMYILVRCTLIWHLNLIRKKWHKLHSIVFDYFYHHKSLQHKLLSNAVERSYRIREKK